MKTDVPTKRDGKDFERFDAMLKRVVAVPKKDIQERETAEQKKKQAKQKPRGKT